jgi:FixJ family two-component response regulator
METQGKQPLIAVVDDDAAVREAVESVLKSIGYGIRAFASAEEFLRAWQPKQLGCLVLDVHLQGMSGMELQQQLAANDAHIPIVFVTAQEDRENRLRAQALHSGAVAFLRKPFAEEELLTAVRNACGLKRSDWDDRTWRE